MLTVILEIACFFHRRALLSERITLAIASYALAHRPWDRRWDVPSWGRIRD